eukprot:986022-Prorocentrum_lima.AAC.1
MTSSLVGSEMCIRDRFFLGPGRGPRSGEELAQSSGSITWVQKCARARDCLLYTSDAADDM